MTPAQTEFCELVRQTVQDEFGTLRMLGGAPRENYPDAVDDAAERQVLAMTREGVKVDVPDDIWGRPINHLVYTALRTMRELGAEPTTDRVMMILKDDGWTDSIRPWVDEALDATPVQMTPRVALSRMREAATRRYLLNELGVIVALLRTGAPMHEVWTKLEGVAS